MTNRFTLTLSASLRLKLEAIRRRLGAKSEAEAVRVLIETNFKEQP